MTFPKLPIQWSENGYEITEELGHGSYGSVYKLVKDKGTENEEVSALKIINWTLDNNTVRYEFTKDLDEARKSYAQRFDQMTQEVNLLESFIMVSPKGYFKLGDFGVARQQISGTMTVIGSYDFMAPEVYKGMPYDQTADIYSLGMVLYYLANDFKLPFSEIQSSIDRINRRMNGDTEWDWKQKLPIWGIAANIKQKMSEEILYDTVMTACANDPKARYQSATAMKRDLMICMDKICAWEKRKDNWEAAKKK